jgi:hypothetical protein
LDFHGNHTSSAQLTQVHLRRTTGW